MSRGASRLAIIAGMFPATQRDLLILREARAKHLFGGADGMRCEMYETLRLATQVATPVGLCAFTFSLVFFVYIRYLKHREQQLNSIPAEERARVYDQFLTRYGVRVESATLADKLKLVQEEMDKRFRMTRLVIFVLAITFVTCFAIGVAAHVYGQHLQQSPNSSNLGQEKEPTHDSTNASSIEKIPLDTLASEFVELLVEDQSQLRQKSKSSPKDIDHKDLLIGSPVERVFDRLLVKHGYNKGYKVALKEHNKLINRLIIHLNESKLVAFPVADDQLNRLNSEPLRATLTFEIQSTLEQEVEWANSFGSFAAKCSYGAIKFNSDVKDRSLRQELELIKRPYGKESCGEPRILSV